MVCPPRGLKAPSKTPTQELRQWSISKVHRHQIVQGSNRKQVVMGREGGKRAGIVPHQCQLTLSVELHIKCYLVSNTVEQSGLVPWSPYFLSAVPSSQMSTSLPTQASLPHSNSPKHLPMSYLHLEEHRAWTLHLPCPGTLWIWVPKFTHWRV